METDYGTMGDQMKKLLELTEENNRMLKAARRDKWIGMIFNLLIWGGVLYATYYFSMQFINPLLSQIQALQGGEIDLTKLQEAYEKSFGQ